MRIIVAEDAALLREALVALLERAGHEVIAALATASELQVQGRRHLCDGSADLLLTDVRMPPGDRDDGLRVALELRHEHPDLPVVALSQYVEPRYASSLLGLHRARGNGSREERLRAGAGYLLKDRVSHVHEFLAALESVRGGSVVVDPTVVSSLMDSGADALAALTAREREILARVSEGETNPQIAEALHLSRGAVVKHVSTVFDKLGISEQEGNHRVLAVLAHLRAGGAGA
jgi:DNA-binding NarL/FixJ family response regulator